MFLCGAPLFNPGTMLRGGPINSYRRTLTTVKLFRSVTRVVVLLKNGELEAVPCARFLSLRLADHRLPDLLFLHLIQQILCNPCRPLPVVPGTWPFVILQALWLTGTRSSRLTPDSFNYRDSESISLVRRR